MSQSSPRSLRSDTMRRRRRTRSNSPFGDEDVPIAHLDHNLYDHIEIRMGCPTRTAFVYDDQMLLHKNIWDNMYFERPDRLKCCFDRIRDLNLLEECLMIEGKEIQKDLLYLIHSQSYVQLIEDTQNMTEIQLKELSEKHDCVFFDNDTKLAALISAGSTIEVLKAILDDRAKNGFCLIRPPGHHAMESEASGFCIFNNIAIAAKYAQLNYSMQKILIIDWDIHHGNATQYQFYDTNKVLYISIHRYEDGTFWPRLRESNYDYIGAREGRGYNINIPLNKIHMTNSDYLAVFHSIILPVSYEFNPDLVLISAGFDSALGCPEGQMDVHPACFAHMTHKLMGLARGKLLVILEGGYCLDSLSECAALTLATLTGKAPPKLEDLIEPSDSIKETIHNSLKFIQFYWKSLAVNVTNSQDDYPEYISKLIFSTWSSAKIPMLPIEKNVMKNANDMSALNKICELRILNPINRYLNKTCFVYDCRMENHMNERVSHPESPRRTQMIYEFLRDNSLLSQCKQLETRIATVEDLVYIHSIEYICTLEKVCQESPDIYHTYEESFNSIYINQHSYSSALLSCGLLLNVVDEVCSGRSQNGFAIIRPPGHHAESHCAMGFCFFNNVAIGAKYAMSKYPDSVKKVLIVDWDVHHGNGTQHQFWTSDKVLYVSLHRYDNGSFFPGSEDGSPTKVGESCGEGFNVNIAWNRRPIRDSEYMSAFITVVMPIAHEYNPDLVIVSCGFDASRGDPLGGLTVTPECYGHMTQMLTCLANGKIILALEGGYNLNMISECMSHCVSSLLGHPTVPINIFPPNKNGIEAIRKTIECQKPYWKCLKFQEPLQIYVEPSNVKITPHVAQQPPIVDSQINPSILAESMRQLAIVEVAFQTERSIEESLSQSRTDGAVAATFDAVDSDVAVPSSGLEQGTPDERDRNHVVPETSGVSSLATLVHSTPTIMHTSLMAVNQSSGANPVSANVSRVYNAGTSVGLALEDIMHLSGVSSSDIHHFLGLTTSDPLPERMYAVQPLSWCEHLALVRQSPSANEIDVNASCCHCPSNQENWMCLTCYQVYCGRFVQGHMLQHFQSTGHALVLSFLDLSSWCYICDSYVHNECLNTAKREAHIAKFGVPHFN